MADWVISNIVVAILLGMALGLTLAVRRSRMWSDTFRDLWRRRRLAIGVVAFYLAVALLDSVAWVGGVEMGEDTVARYQAQSVLDRLFADSHERSYSAPLAEVEFYGGAPLRDPGRHLLGLRAIQ